MNILHLPTAIAHAMGERLHNLTDLLPLHHAMAAQATQTLGDGHFILRGIQESDFVIKIVIGLLLLLSIASWAVILEKYFLLRKINYRAHKFEKLLNNGTPLYELYTRLRGRPQDPISVIFCHVMSELDKGPANINQLEHMMNAAYTREMVHLEKNLSLLATTAASSPFIGLFGTVWGIIVAFGAIANQHQTSLSAIAPGIGDALFSTAVGLVAAIPATIFYNKLTVDIDKYRGRVESFMDELPLRLQRTRN